MKFKSIDICYDEKNWREKYCKEFDEKLDKFLDSIDNSLVNECNNNYEELLYHKKEYKNNYNGLVHFLIVFAIPFGLLLFVYPGILLIKKFKEISKLKKSLLNNITECEQNTITSHKKLLSNFDGYPTIKNIIANDLQYTDYGPITTNLINELQSVSIFDLSADSNHNTYDTSWGSFNNNIVINYTTFDHSIFNKIYKGSETVFWRDSDNRYNSTIVTATYTHPCVHFGLNKHFWCFSEYTQELEFKYTNTHSGKIFKKNKKNKAEFENQGFSAKYSWSFNNETQIRMVFTPYFQEHFLELNNNEAPPPHYRIKKQSLFYGNESNCASLVDFFPKSVISFKNDPYYSYDSFRNDYKKEAITYLHQWYINLSFMTIIPIIQSEDQTPIIRRILNADKNNYSFSVWEIHYIISCILQQKLIIRDTDTMHTIKNYFELRKEEFCLYDVNIDAYSYDAVSKVIYIPTSSPAGVVDVPVNYIDYIRQDASGKVVFCKIRNNNFYYNHNTYKNVSSNNNINLIANKIVETTKCKNIIIKNGYAAIMTNDNVSINSLFNLFYELWVNVE